MSEQKDLVSQLVLFLHLRKYEPGERVPSEREMAERFQVSRGHIREALAFLEALRVIERRAKSGIFMAREAASVEALALYAQVGAPLTAEDVQQSIEMRKIHEITAVRLACERATLDNFDRLRAILAASEAKMAAGQPINEEDRAFHLEIVRATQNSIFHRIVQVYYLMTVDRLRIYFNDPARCRTSHEEHLAIFQAVARRDAMTAMNLMSEHLKGANSYWQDLIGRGAPPGPGDQTEAWLALATGRSH
ncbi:FadR/GntR family transcriptional regulator [Labrys wisconsinensis]|uniref:DNA-binding FadR family transcriptional regulator n=1 Tax=Labrys wisconsinensis TaxID=425677 RepID=A0ABU0JLW0_9HYPH|nr:FCD domain-containing protein [Labrys wisconsinensis]MDQ0475278.1 DNA-binding FadR family transcriptional regulator [Labrys wisconsinensis]